MVCAILSIVTLWCQAVLPIRLAASSTNLSLIAVILRYAEDNTARQLVGLLFFGYLCACTYHSMFSLKMFSSLELTGNRGTDAYALLFNAAYLCRLQFSLAFNFLNLSRFLTEGTDLPLTSYDASVGMGLPLSTVDLTLPLVMVFFSVLMLLNGFERFLRLVGYPDRKIPHEGNAEDDERIRDGRTLMDAGESACLCVCVC